jgi:hypothetical protein
MKCSSEAYVYMLGPLLVVLFLGGILETSEGVAYLEE